MRRGSMRWWALCGVIGLLVAGGGVALSGSSRSGGSLVSTAALGSRPLTKAASRPFESKSAAAGGPTMDAVAALPQAAGGGASDAGRSAGVSAAAPATTPTPSLSVGPKIIRTATMSVEVARHGFRAAFTRAATIAGQQGGFVTTSNSQSHEGAISTGTVQLRVPADRFDAAREALVGLGKLTDEQVNGEDVGGQLVDIDARVRSLSAQEAALRTLMAKANTIGETIQVQDQLTQVRQQIETLSGQKAHLEDSAALATITLSLGEPGVSVVTKPRSPAPSMSRNLHRAGRAALAEFGGILVVLGYLLPFGLLALVGWAGWRLVVRRHPPAVSA